MPQQLREKLATRGLSGTRIIGFRDKLPPDVAQVGRTHPLVATLAGTMAEGALDPNGVEGKATLGRTGVWMTRGIDKLTVLLALRLRFKLVTSGRRTLLAEEATGIAFGPQSNQPIAMGAEALALLEHEATRSIEPPANQRQIDLALARHADFQPAIAAYAAERAAALSHDHERVKAATRGEGVTTTVEPVLPADIIGLYVLVPEAN